MRGSRWDVVSVVSLAGAAALTVAVYDRLPDPMATHFDLEGHANGWMPRAMGAWFAPVLGAALWAFMRLSPKILPATEKKRLPDSQMAMIASLTAAFVAAIHVLLLHVSVVPGASLTRPIWLLLGLFFVAIGLVLPRVRRNAIVGIRTPWTLTSDENWARSNRLAGYSMVIGGVLAGLVGALGGPLGGGIAIVALLASGLVPAVYSLMLARKRDQGETR